METKFAPAARSPYDLVLENYKSLSRQPYIDDIINSLPNIGVILNVQRQIVYANDALLEMLQIKDLAEVLGRRPGELFNCVHAFTEEGGCGTSESCRFCGAVNTILSCLKENKKVVSESRLTVRANDVDVSMDLLVCGTPIIINDEKHIIVSINDISNEKRRLLLERMFFHDILNTTSNIKGYAELISNEIEPSKIKKFGNIIENLSEELSEEIMSQRDIFMAESHILKVEKRWVFIDDIVLQVLTYMKGFLIKTNKDIALESVKSGLEMVVDHLLLKRVLINLIKNAIEASDPGLVVTVGSRKTNQIIEIFVNNKSVMSNEVQMQVFQRSFSTKGRNRGIGTYSAKLITEEYLKGKISFKSNDESGTTFILSFSDESNSFEIK